MTAWVLGTLAAWVLLSVPAGFLAGRWLRASGLAADQGRAIAQVADSHTTRAQLPERADPRPAPGHQPPAAHGTSPPPAPPGLPHLTRDGRLMVVHLIDGTLLTWRCGCFRGRDGQGRETWRHDCEQAPATDWDEELRRLTS